MSPIETEIVRAAAALEALEPAWWDLWRRAWGATPFGSPAWLIPWWRAFHPGALTAAAAWKDGRLVGLAPFYREDGSLGRRLLPVGISAADYHDVLLDEAHASEAGAALMAALAGDASWDTLELEELPPDAAALALPAPPGCMETVSAQSACPVLTLSGPDLNAFLPGRTRRMLNLARNRAARRGGFRIERARGADLPAAFDALVRLHASRWRARGEDGVLADGRVRVFHAEALLRLDAAGVLRLYALNFEDAPAAVFYGFVHGGRGYSYLTGFDPAFAFESPGALLLAHAVTEAIGEGVREFHFLRGREAYKHEWGAVDRWNRRRSFRRIAAEKSVADAGDSWLSAVPERFRRPLALAARGSMPPNVALMHVLMEARDEAEARSVLREAAAAAGEGDAVGGLLDLCDAHPQAFAAVKAVLARVAHDAAPAAGGGTVRALAAAFDAAARAAPEASVALYTLGSPALMRAATEEIVAALGRWGVVAPDRAMLEIGCGIGRFEEALAPELRLAVGIDVSSAMLRAARERCAGLANAAFVQTSGLDLSAFGDESFDLVLAADSFPYLVQAGPALLARHVEEAARVLRPGGDLVILNLSYRGDLDRDRRDLARLCAGAFAVRRNGVQGEFHLWDGAVFHLSRIKAR